MARMQQEIDLSASHPVMVTETKGVTSHRRCKYANFSFHIHAASNKKQPHNSQTMAQEVAHISSPDAMHEPTDTDVKLALTEVVTAETSASVPSNGTVEAETSSDAGDAISLASKSAAVDASTATEEILGATDTLRREVSYKAEWYHPKTDILKSIPIDSLAVLKAAQVSSTTTQTAKYPEVMEVITLIGTRARKSKPAKSVTISAPAGSQKAGWDDDNIDDDENPPAISDFLQKFEVTEVGTLRIVIYSAKLLNAIRRLIHYYPFQALTGDTVTIFEPYECLVHHHDQFETLRQPCEDLNGVECRVHGHRSLCCDETKRHVKILLDYLQPTMESKIRPAQKKLELATPVISYENLWLIYKPGTEIWTHIPEKDGSPAGSVELTSVVYGSRPSVVPENNENAMERAYAVSSWCMCSDGDNVGRSTSHTYVRKFEGDKEVSQLEAYPLIYHGDKGTRVKHIERGRLVADLFMQRSKPVLVDGIAYIKNNQPRRYKGKAIIDPSSTARLSEITHWFASPEVVLDRSLIFWKSRGMRIRTESSINSRLHRS
ncbi:uncharacterized protein AB675_3563 [Cyphellophora attinorum]|uniref:DUF7025 domain-containing protein n=1 Tax=Cyphellophora attinorum TaxID=1664694 RepID=A0A0N1H3Z6_9EURO|nr:uncharacterized protein AB675_3563 [Phialophora attinorum]KPI39784.1 hypothetical protein AB675_3563 [Phialophora attinorum]